MLPMRGAFIDMHGNVWEWTADAASTYASMPRADPLNSGELARPVISRGGSWSISGGCSSLSCSHP